MAQMPAYVRVVGAPAPLQRWLHADSEILMEVAPGTTLFVLDEEREERMTWFWVVAPPTPHGTRKAGWIPASAVEPVAAPAPPAQAAKEDGGNLELGATDVKETANAAPVDTPEDKVTITPRDEAAASAPSIVKTYTFPDIHFDRDRDALRAEDMDALRVAAAALKADPALVVTIEGYTCSLGSTAYNVALGARRANAVRNFFVSEGIAADRLHTVSLGEGHAAFDNSQEETRRLNRRVALVPNLPE